MEFPPITVGVVNYNGMADLPATIHAIDQLQYPDCAVVVVDNGSSDGSPQWLAENYPNVQCIMLGENIGLPGARNVLLENATTDYVLILDNDIRVEPDALTLMMKVMSDMPDIGICHPEICDADDPVVYHYNGGFIHYLATHISRNQPVLGELREEFEQFDVVSGAAMLLRRQTAFQIGGFDADYFFNWEDGDFSARMSLAGYRCLNIPRAIVHHSLKPRGTTRVFYQVRNRWYFILKLYDWHTLLFVSPMLVLFEILQAALLLKKGAIFDYLNGTRAAIFDLPLTLSKRRAFKKLKIKRDRDWLRAGQMYVPPDLIRGSRFMVVGNQLLSGLFRTYWRFVRPFC